MTGIRKKITTAALFCLGAASLIAQVALMRELSVSFFGNELFIGLTLAVWLLSVGAGSLWPACAAGNGKGPGRLYLLGAGALLVSLPLARAARLALAGSGVEPGLLAAAVWSVLVIAPAGLFLGALFVRLVGHYGDEAGLGTSPAVSRGYVIEGLGFFLGAVLFHFWLFRLPGLSVILLLAAVNLALAFVFWVAACQKKTVMGLAIAGAVLAVSVGLAIYKSAGWDFVMSGWLYPGQELLYAENTRYGNAAATGEKEQVNFYYNGRLSDNSQNQFHNELMTHPLLLTAPAHGKVLVIGNGFTGLIGEIKKYKPEKIVYLEPDRDYLAAEKIGYGPGVGTETVHEDARQYLRHTAERFDAGVVNYANPATLAENRYFTEEFFRLLASRLNGGGVIALRLETTPNYTQGAQNELLAVLYRTLSAVFPYVYVLPDNEVLFLASKARLDSDAAALAARAAGLGLKTAWTTPAMIDWRFTGDRSRTLTAALAGTAAAVNSDFKPVLYYAELRLFLAKAGFKPDYILFFGVGIFAAALVWRRKLRSALTGCSLLLVSAVPEFCLLALEVILIFAFQTFQGYLYARLGFIIALVLLGIAAGSFWFSRLLSGHAPERLLRRSYALIAAAFFAPLVLLLFWPGAFNFAFVFYLLSVLSGFAVGTKFPAVNALYLKRKNARAGAVYGADLFGAAAGAFAAGTLLLPVLGLIGSLAVLAGLSMIGCVLILIFA